MFKKFGVVKMGETPSVISGDKSCKYKNGEALAKNEKIASTKKLQHQIGQINIVKSSN